MSILNFVVNKTEETISTIVSLSSEEWKNIVKNVKISFGKKLKIKGFRSGNVPIELVSRYVSSKDILLEAEEKGVDIAFVNLKKEKEKELEFYRPFKKSIKKISYDELEVEFIFEKLPTIKISEYKNLNISIKTKPISDKEILDSIENKKQEFAKLVEKGEIAKKNLFVNIDFEGFIDDKKIEKASMKNFSLELGSNKFIPGFENNVIGMKKGEIKDIKLKFPENYEPEFANKEIVFKVVLNKVEEKIKLTTNELLKQLELKTEIDLKNSVLNELKNTQNQKQRSELILKINKEIINKSKIELPKSYLEREYKALKENQINYLNKQNIKLETFLKNKKISLDKFEQELKKQTEDTIKELLIYYEISEKENIKISQKEIDDYYQMLSQYTKKNIEEIKNIYPQISLYNNFLKTKIEEFLINNNFSKKSDNK